MRWKGLDHGQEGLFAAPLWFSVLEVLGRHEGEDLRDTASPVYDDLRATIPGRSWTGQDGNRPFFRDYPKAWVNLGVILSNEDTDGILTLTEKGRAILAAPETLVEFYRDYIDHQHEIWELDGYREVVAPLEVIARIAIAHPGCTIEEAQKLAQDLVAASLRMRSDELFEVDQTNSRRFRTYFIILENAGALRRVDGRVVVEDRAYLESLVRDELLEAEAQAELEIEVEVESEANDEDLRKFQERRSAVREGQKAFSDAIRAAYGNRCCVTGASERSVLDAAHISPYLGRHTNGVENGLLLAVDIHRLFDRDLLAIDPETLVIRLSSAVTDPRYVVFEGQEITTPDPPARGPSREALRRRLEAFDRRNASN